MRPYGCIPRLCALALIALALIAVPLAISSCGPTSYEKAALQASEGAFDAAVLALEALDATEVGYLESLDAPTPEDIRRAQGHVRLAEAARESLARAREALKAGDVKTARAELLDAGGAIDTIATELEALGLKLPGAVHRGLEAMKLLAQLPLPSSGGS